MKGRKPRARARDHPDAPALPDVLPRCPPHLSHVARKEWRRLATPLWEAGVLTIADRAALAAYCQAYGRWAEAEEKLAEGPTLIKSPSGHVQQSPWLSIANKQLELMGRYMAELGLTPVSRSRMTSGAKTGQAVDRIELVAVFTDEQGNRREEPVPNWKDDRAAEATGKTTTIELDPRL